MPPNGYTIMNSTYTRIFQISLLNLKILLVVSVENTICLKTLFFTSWEFLKNEKLAYLLYVGVVFFLDHFQH